MNSRSLVGPTRSRIAARAGVALILIAAVFCASLLNAARANAGDDIIVHKLGNPSSSGAKQLRGSAFRNAAPLPPPTRSLPAERAAPSRGVPSGKPGFVEGHVPAGLAVAEATTRAGEQARGFGKYTSQPVSEPTVYPNTTNGKVLGKIPGVGLYTCSASVVHAKNKSTIFTAGHCVKDPGKNGKFAKFLSFAPAYSNKPTIGTWDAKAIVVSKAWAKRGNINYDYAAAVVKPAGPQKKVEKVAGSKGFAFNVSVKKKKKSLRAVGYPFNKERTEVMWECRSRFGGYDPGYAPPGPRAIGIGCDMTEGASGGGWTIPGEYLASVSSFTYPHLPGRLYGPYFTKAADKLRKKAGRVGVR